MPAIQHQSHEPTRAGLSPSCLTAPVPGSDSCFTHCSCPSLPFCCSSPAGQRCPQVLAMLPPQQVKLPQAPERNTAGQREDMEGNPEPLTATQTPKGHPLPRDQSCCCHTKHCMLHCGPSSSPARAFIISLSSFLFLAVVIVTTPCYHSLCETFLFLL